MKSDAEILDWLERSHTLHYTVEALYAVDGYVVSIMYDGAELAQFHQPTLREAYAKAMVWEFDPCTRRMRYIG